MRNVPHSHVSRPASGVCPCGVMVALAGPLTAGGGEGNERFEFGLEVLLRGLAAMSDKMGYQRAS
jgi:hypothetical protein